MMDRSIVQEPLLNWIPYKLIIENDQILCHWLYTSNHRFTDPFFEETTLKCLRHPYNSGAFKSMSSIESMIEWSELFPNRIPEAFIFHISRCGSTLLSQLISLDPQCLVLSEVPFFDNILQLPFKLKNVDDTLRENAFRAAIKIIGQNKTEHQQRLIIKTDSWHIFSYKFLRQLYPFAEFILLYRSPDEVLRSHQKLRGLQAVPGVIQPEVFGFTEKEITGLSLDAYTSNVLEKYLMMLETTAEKDKHTLLLDYKQGAMDMVEDLADHLKINWKEEHMIQMQERSKFHSKRPMEGFMEDRKMENLPESIQKAMIAYQRLDKKRKPPLLKN